MLDPWEEPQSAWLLCPRINSCGATKAGQGLQGCTWAGQPGGLYSYPSATSEVPDTEWRVALVAEHRKPTPQRGAPVATLPQVPCQGPNLATGARHP